MASVLSQIHTESGTDLRCVAVTCSDVTYVPCRIRCKRTLLRCIQSWIQDFVLGRGWEVEVWEMVGDMSRVTLNFDLSKIPFVWF